jgi:hypothetical protein
MRSGFTANVPARKPRTQIGRVLSELANGTDDSESNGTSSTHEVNGTSEVRAPFEAAAETQSVAASVEAPPAAPAPRAAPAPTPAVARAAERTPVTAKPAAEPIEPSASSRRSSGRERLATLRERLALAAHTSTGSVEPKRTAATVKEVVDGLRARLDASVRERAEMAATIEEVRAALARAQAELQRERKARAAVEAQAEERGRIAAEAVAEAEALAAERDQILAELTEQRRFEDEQAAFLVEADEALAQRALERENAARELAEARELTALRTAEVADLEFRLKAEAADRARVEARCRELEAEIARLNEASEALESIDALVTRGR